MSIGTASRCGMEFLLLKQPTTPQAPRLPPLPYGAGMSAPGYAQVGGQFLYDEAANRVDPLKTPRFSAAANRLLKGTKSSCAATRAPHNSERAERPLPPLISANPSFAAATFSSSLDHGGRPPPPPPKVYLTLAPETVYLPLLGCFNLPLSITPTSGGTWAASTENSRLREAHEPHHLDDEEAAEDAKRLGKRKPRESAASTATAEPGRSAALATAPVPAPADADASAASASNAASGEPQPSTPEQAAATAEEAGAPHEGRPAPAPAPEFSAEPPEAHGDQCEAAMTASGRPSAAKGALIRCLLPCVSGGRAWQCCRCL